MSTHTTMKSFDAISLTHTFEAGDFTQLPDHEVALIFDWMNVIKRDELRLMDISTQIASEISRASMAGDYILEKSPHEIADKIKSGRAAVLPARYSDGTETFRCFWSVANLVNDEFFDEFPVMEGGSLISNSHSSELVCNEDYRSSHAIQIAQNLSTIPDDGLVIITSRSNESKQACVRGGATMLKRAYFPMLDSLTCDPTCKPGSDGRQAGIGRVIMRDSGNCIACPVNEVFSDGLADSCYLLSLSVDRAYELEQKLAEKFSNDAVLARRTLIGG